jgi:hypothetical protein
MDEELKNRRKNITIMMKEERERTNDRDEGRSKEESNERKGRHKKRLS